MLNKTVTVETTDLELLLACSLEYAMGRMSYIVSEVADLIKKHWKCISPQKRTTLTRLLGDELLKAKGLGCTLGMDMDQEVWVNLHLWMKDSLNAT